jgi:hypothetical protein
MPDAPIDIDNQVTVTQLRAQWTTPSFGAGESSWSFIQPAANPDYQLSVLGPWVDHLLPLFRAARPMGWRLNTIRVEDRWPSLRAAIIVEDGWGPIPDTDVQGLPPQCTPVISWRTGIIGRSNRGRTYWGPIKLTDCEYSNVLGDGDTAVFNFADEMINRFTGATFPSNPHFAIVSRVHDGMPVLPIGTYCNVTHYSYESRFGIMRRRLEWDWRT